MRSDEQDRLLQHSTPGRSISQISFSEKTHVARSNLAGKMWKSESIQRVIQVRYSKRMCLVCLQRTTLEDVATRRASVQEDIYTNQDIRMMFRFSSRKLERIRLDALIRWTAPTERMLSWNKILLCCQRRDVPLTRTTGTFLTGEESDFLFFEKCLFFSCFFYGADGMFFLKRSGK